MVDSTPTGVMCSMFRSVSLAALFLMALSLTSDLGAQTTYQPNVPSVSGTINPAIDHSADLDQMPTQGTPSLKVRDEHIERTLRLGPGDLLQISIYGAPDLTTEARVNPAGNINMALIGSVHLAGLTADEAQQFIAARLREGGLLVDPQVNVFAKEYANGGIAVMGEVQKPGIYTLPGERKLYEAISAAGGTTGRAGRAVTITNPSQSKPLIVDIDYRNPSKSPYRS